MSQTRAGRAPDEWGEEPAQNIITIIIIIIIIIIIFFFFLPFPGVPFPGKTLFQVTWCFSLWWAGPVPDELGEVLARNINC